MAQILEKFALLVGINYIGTSSVLYGCVNDAQNVYNILKNKFNYEEKNMKILTDNTSELPTKKNIIEKLTEMIQNKKNCQFFFHYSGHGTNVTDKNRDEKDYRDECLVPLDYMNNGFIVDDDLQNILENFLDPSCSFFSVIDACHSGTMLDLKYAVNCDAQRTVNDYTVLYKPEQWSSKFSFTEQNNSVIPKTIMLSGCRDDQTSADAYLNGSSQGALTFCFLNVLEMNNYQLSYKKLLKDIHCIMQLKRFNQRPVLSFGESLELDVELKI